MGCLQFFKVELRKGPLEQIYLNCQLLLDHFSHYGVKKTNTPTSISTGTAIISLQPKTVFPIQWHLGQRWSIPSNRKWITSGKSYLHVIFHHGPSTVYAPNSTTNTTSTINKQPLQTNTTTSTTKDPTTKTFPSWYPTHYNLGKSSRRPAIPWASRCISKATTSSEPFTWPLRINTINTKKVR